MSATTKTATSPAAKPQAAPPTLADFPAFAAAAKKLSELRDRHDATRRAIDEYEFKASNSHRGILRPELEAQAERVLRGEAIDFAAEKAFDRAKAERELAVFARAVEMQELVLASKRHEASAAIRERVSPRHRAIAARMRAALAALRAAVLDNADLNESLARGDVAFGAPLQQLANIAFGDPSNPVERIDRWLADLGAYGE